MPICTSRMSIYIRVFTLVYKTASIMYKKCNYTRTMCHCNDIILFYMRTNTVRRWHWCVEAAASTNVGHPPLQFLRDVVVHTTVTLLLLLSFFFIIFARPSIFNFYYYSVVENRPCEFKNKTSEYICGHTPSNVSCVSIPRFPHPLPPTADHYHLSSIN